MNSMNSRGREEYNCDEGYETTARCPKQVLASSSKF